MDKSIWSRAKIVCVCVCYMSSWSMIRFHRFSVTLRALVWDDVWKKGTKLCGWHCSSLFHSTGSHFDLMTLCWMHICINSFELMSIYFSSVIYLLVTKFLSDSYTWGKLCNWAKFVRTLNPPGVPLHIWFLFRCSLQISSSESGIVDKQISHMNCVSWVMGESNKIQELNTT
jgi:hypothetical protein